MILIKWFVFSQANLKVIHHLNSCHTMTGPLAASSTLRIIYKIFFTYCLVKNHALNPIGSCFCNSTLRDTLCHSHHRVTLLLALWHPLIIPKFFPYILTC